MKKIFLLLLLFFSATVIAEEPELEDFAYSMPIITDGNAPMYHLQIPEQVYNNTTQPELGDIRIFNRDKQRVPFVIRKPETQRTIQKFWVDLPVFPIKGKISHTTQDLDFNITVNDAGKIINIEYNENGKLQDQQTIESYIFDLSSVKQNIDELSFIITNGEGGYLKSVIIEKSEDLNNWGTLVSNATLSKLTYANHTLEKNNINIPAQKVRYLRFTWRDNSEGLQIISARALLTSTTTEIERHWSTVTGVQSAKDTSLYDYEVPGQYPIDQVNIILPDDNTLIEATLRSRKDPNSSWSMRYKGVFYKLQMNDTLIELQPIDIRPTTDRYWQLDVKTEEGLGDGQLQLNYSWVPNEIYFLARGEGPFTLAYGNSRAQEPLKPVDTLMRILSDEQQKNMIQSAGLGDVETLKGDTALQPVKEIPWKQIILWMMLVSAVIIIAFMAYRLLREMNNTG